MELSLKKKTISLDYGNNLMKIEVDIAGTENVAAGISLQENNGTVLDRNNIVIYKQNHFETILSNAILTPKNTMRATMCTTRKFRIKIMYF